jgi:tetrahydromethanopterin S-methyltransferase subunit D
MTATTVEQPSGGLAWYALSAQDVTAQMGVDADTGLTVNIMLLFVVAASFAIGGTIRLSRLRQGGDRLGAEDKAG